MGASNILNRASTLVKIGYGEDLQSMLENQDQSSLENYEQSLLENHEQSSFADDLRSSVANPRSDYTNSETWAKPNPRSGYTDSRSEYTDLKNSLVSAMRKLVTSIQEEYIDEERGVLNKDYMKKNEEFRDEIINFVRDKKELDLKKILDRRCKTNKLNTSGKEYLAKCILSKDNTKDVIKILAKYYESD